MNEEWEQLSAGKKFLYGSPEALAKSREAEAKRNAQWNRKIAAFVEAQKKSEPARTVAEMNKIINKQNRENGNSKIN